MKIEELQAKKKTLESALEGTINRLMNDFGEDTGVTPAGLSFDVIDTTSFGDVRKKLKYIPRVIVEI